MENAIYLKDSNPTAFNELQKLWAKSGVINFTLDKLRASYTDCLAEWKCREGHIWLSEVACRENELNDMECPICQNHRLNLYPRLLRHYIHESAKRNIMKSEWYCKECHQVFILNDENIPHYDATPYHTCIPYDTPVFASEYPKLAEEWSDKNILKGDEIDEYFQNEVIWICNECKGEWFSTISQRIFGKKKCPYCTNKYPTAGVDTLFDKHSEKMEEWSYRLNNTLNPSTLKDNSDKFVFWDCKKCGLSYGEKINVKMKAQSSTCPHCKKLGIEKSETDLIYSEYVPNKSKEVYNYDFFLNPKSQVRQEWKCKECDNIWYASAYDRFYNKEKCPYCTGKYAIPGKSSLKALYPEIIKKAWLVRCNFYICNPDMVLPNSPQKAWFHCLKCNHSNYISIRKYILNYRRGINSCSYCDGLRKRKIRFF